MKKLKSVFALLAIVMGLSAAFAFKAPVKTSNLANPYWHFVGGDPTQPGSYTKLSGQPSCAGSANICAIEAPVNPSAPSQPVINSALSNRISTKDTSNGDVFLKQ